MTSSFLETASPASTTGPLSAPHHNAGIAGDTTDALLSRLQKKPGTLVLMIGINDLLQGHDVKHIEEKYAEIFEKIEGTDKVVILSLLPVKAVPETAALNQNVKQLNRYLHNESQKSGFAFVDLYSFMTDRDEGLIASYTSDGVHLTPEGYRIWEETLTPFLQ